MQKSESIKELTTALAKAQIAFKPIKRTEKVGYETKGGGSKKYSYAPLGVVIEATKEALSVNELAITQPTKLIDGNIILETVLSHSTGEWLSGELYVGKQDLAPQILGSALTYMRRYGYSAMLCVSSEEDDDGQEASKVAEKKSPQENTRESTTNISLTAQQLYETASAFKTGGELCAFAREHGWTNDRLKKALGIEKSTDIKDVIIAAVVLFPKPKEVTKGRLAEEAIKLGAKEIEEVK